ncbi:MAG: peroxiredoxin-like family protein [Ferruginibacter sp.]
MKKVLIAAAVFFAAFPVFAQTGVMYPSGLSAGEAAPLFSISQNSEKIFDLADALKKGPVVLVFYRGQWCPYCNKYLSRLNDSLRLVKDKGAVIVALSPEVQANIVKTAEKTKAAFPVLHDSGMLVMKRYKVNFDVDEKTVNKYKEYGIDFNEANGINGASLPVPATYIIGTDGIIRYVFFNTDYRKRPSVKEILDNL